ncbi:MAG: hypothetical protein LBQ13_04305 [Endomicrobium sp.]|jgi:hypothetical protein|nr:hypothetical protein [Endomicrobium sp.]
MDTLYKDHLKYRKKKLEDSIVLMKEGKIEKDQSVLKEYKSITEELKMCTENKKENENIPEETNLEVYLENSDRIIPQGIAKIFYKSGLFTDIKSEAQAIVKILAGRALGLSPIQSMTNVYIIKDKIGYSTKVYLSKIKKTNGKYDYSVIESTDESCVLEFYKDGEVLGRSSFNREKAQRSGLINYPTYKGYPQLMFFYRAASTGIKMYMPEILDGGAFIEDFIEVEGNESSQKKVVAIEGNEINVKEGSDGGDQKEERL